MGKTLTLSARARRAGLDPELVRDRIRRSHWSEKRALTTPVLSRAGVLKLALSARAKGSIAERARAAGIPRTCASSRLRAGWSEDRTFSTPVMSRAETIKFAQAVRARLPSLATAARLVGLPPKTVQKRVQSGWTIERALTAPLGERLYNGGTKTRHALSSPRCQNARRSSDKTTALASMLLGRRVGRSIAQRLMNDMRVAGIIPPSLSQRARDAGVHYETVRYRIIHMGWSKERALSTPPGKAK